MELLRPRLILAVGRIAAQNLLQTDTPIGRLRGQLHRFGAAGDAVDRHLPSGLPAAQPRREAQGLDRSEVRARELARLRRATRLAVMERKHDGGGKTRRVGLPELSIRPMHEADVPEVVRIERASYAFPWTEGIFRDCLRVNYFCRVVEIGPARSSATAS